MLKRKSLHRRPMPTEQSVHWKPLRDSHYVLASLQPNHGGRHQIFISQKPLARVERLARAVSGRHAFGLLLGQRYECSVTGAIYFIIESLGEQSIAPSDETSLATAVHHALATVTDKRTEILGWYCSVPMLEARPMRGTTAIHASYFPEPWQAMLLIADESSAPGGAFFLHDRAAARWFYSPFFELPDHARKPPAPKATLVAWPQYLTTDVAIAVSPDQVTGDYKGARAASSIGDVPRRRHLFRADKKHRGASADVAQHPADVRPQTGHSASRAADAPAVEKRADTAPGPLLERLRERVSARRSRRDAGQNRPPAPEKDVQLHDRETPLTPTVEAGVRRVKDSDDTRAGDDPGRFLELAQAEGFFVVARFDHADTGEGPESLWLLNDPYSGMLLTVVAAGDEVIDASLHYNVQADEAVLARTFPEHRDLASRTVYVRESCVDFLRARCRRLRAAGTLERAWTVSPAIYLITPGEWASTTDHLNDAGGDASAIRALNDARVAALPIPIRHQFRLAPEADRTPMPYSTTSEPEQSA